MGTDLMSVKYEHGSLHKVQTKIRMLKPNPQFDSIWGWSGVCVCVARDLIRDLVYIHGHSTIKDGWGLLSGLRKL